ncbi:MAG: radical SAM protein [Candidatus Aenigmarchaeota archaeon]|nr:radical SAM protein [Candidatus Aenigmarchaeota archaeon]
MLVNIDINTYCNIACRFCYRDSGGKLDLESMKAIADEFKDAESFQIGGGEPFFHENFLDFLQYLTEKGKDVHIATNATHIPGEFLGLDNKDRVTVQVNIPASTREKYAEIARFDEFDAAIANLGELKGHYATLISSAIYKDNLGDVPGLIGLSREMHVPLRVNLVFPVGSGRKLRLLNRKEIEELRTSLLKERMAGADVYSPLLAPNNCPALQATYGMGIDSPTCPALRGEKVYINPRGERYSCEFLDR